MLSAKTLLRGREEGVLVAAVVPFWLLLHRFGRDQRKGLVAVSRWRKYRKYFVYIHSTISRLWGAAKGPVAGVAGDKEGEEAAEEVSDEDEEEKRDEERDSGAEGLQPLLPTHLL